MTKSTHTCANCIMWSRPPTQDLGACEIYDHVELDHPLFAFEGEKTTSENGSVLTTAVSKCNGQVPIPPPGPPCPKCSEPTIEGFGLAFGGYGPYIYCPKDGCGYFEKFQELPEVDLS